MFNHFNYHLILKVLDLVYDLKLKFVSLLWTSMVNPCFEYLICIIGIVRDEKSTMASFILDLLH